jgi:dihydrofolate synthase / folylpolyglutamate synthase
MSGSGCDPRPPLEWLAGTQSFGVSPGLERMRRLLRELGNPETRLRTLHVAGTNGKGSVCAFAESVLRAAGYRTGLYTSPHLVDFSERIRVGGETLPEDLLEEGITRLRAIVGGWSPEEHPTFFELATALAFDCLDRAGCEVVVLETGLGGRLDATNTAPKLACAITPVALDHTEWLGPTLDAIAREKAGIFRPGVPAVIAPQEPEAAAALREVARRVGAPCEWIDRPLEGVRLGLAGSHQCWNAALALSLLQAAGLPVSGEAVAGGLASAVWPGRFQRLRGGSLVLDGAHNRHAARQLAATWREEFGQRRCRLVFGALRDKEPADLLGELTPLASEILLVPVASPRSADPRELAEHVVAQGVPVRVFGSVPEALGELFPPGDTRNTRPESPVLLAGSLFLVGEALALEAGKGILPRMQ